MKIYNFIYLRIGLKLKKIHGVFEFNQSQWFKPYVEFNSQKMEIEKNGEQDGKALYKLMNNAVSQPAFTCSKLAKKITVEQGVKYVQS